MSEEAEKPSAVKTAEVAKTPSTPPAPKTDAAVQAKAANLPPIVEFKGVSKTYDDGFTAIKDVTFCVDDLPDKMEFITILGPSGSGKSTILRLIAGLAPQYPATTGDVLVQGRQVQGPGPDRGMVFQDYTSFDNRTVEDNVAFGLECRGVPTKDRREQAREWIEKVGLNVDRDALKYPHQLSGGMRQRVAIARSLILKPKIMLMDEPFGALDPRTRLNMQDMLVSLTREAEATVFFVTHSIEEAVYLGDRTFIISSAPGTILKQMPVPPPDFPARVMQQQPHFMELVFEIRDIMETLESSTRAGDE
jgi:ABC-type nitrate/sulfonate/bicarbonate transport system ATPase subunit